MDFYANIFLKNGDLTEIKPSLIRDKALILNRECEIISVNLIFYDKILSFILADKQNSAYLLFCNIARIFFRVKSGLAKDRIFTLYKCKNIC